MPSNDLIIGKGELKEGSNILRATTSKDLLIGICRLEVSSLGYVGYVGNVGYIGYVGYVGYIC